MLTACSSSEEPKVQTENNQNEPKSEVIVALERYNASIEPAHDSRLFGRFGHWCAVGVADVLGAYRLAQVGGTIGGLLGPGGVIVGGAVGGIVGGVGASYAVDVTISSAPPRGTDVYRATVDLYAECSTMVMEEDDDISIICPHESRTQIVKMGVMHNKMMSGLKGADIREPQLAETKDINDVYAEQLLSSDEYRDAFVSFLENIETKTSVEVTCESDEILNMFVAAIRSAESDKDVVIGIVNDYINIIEENSTLTEEEKQVLYSAFAVAAYSCKYWTEIDNDFVLNGNK